jgi:predicted metal-binding protein
MAKIAILGCKRIQDSLCIACAKCLKAMSLREGEFSRYSGDELELVALGDCGDCPGLIMPKITLMNEIISTIDSDYDAIHLGTCVQKAKATGDCPLDFEKLSSLVKQNFNKKLIVGTHPY